MANEKLEIEIILNDGQVVKGFGNIQRAAKEVGQTVGQTFEKDGGGGVLQMATMLRGPAMAALAVVGTAVFGIKKAFDFSMQAESVRMVSNQFEMLASRADIAGDALKQALIGATEGEVATTDLLKAANEALIELGDNASRLPEIMALARQASLVFGGEIVDRFASINQAIASGNTRSLRQIGLFIDQEQAVKTYAQSLGVAAQSLTLAGKQQAILNAVLEKGKVAFDGIKDTKEVTSAVERLQVSLKNAWQNLTGLFTSALGGAMEKAVNALASSIDNLNTSMTARLGEGSEKTSAKIKVLKSEISDLESEISRFQATAERQRTGGLSIGRFVETSGPIREREAAIRNLRAELEKLQNAEDRQMMLAEKRAGASSQGTKPGSALVDQSAEGKRRLALEQQLSGFRQSSFSAQEQYFNQLEDSAEKVSALDYLANEKRLLAANEYQLKLSEINLNSDLTEQQRQIAREQLSLQHNNRLLSIQDETTKRQIQLQRDLNTAFTNGYRNVMVNAIAGFAGALVKGGNAFEDFGKNMLGMLGDIAIQMGTMIMFAGQGLTQMVTGNPAGSIMFGAALIAVGGILKALSQGGISGASGASASAASSPVASADMTTAPETVETRQQTQVQVVVQGNVLDRRESGMAIVEVLNEYFSANDGRLVSVT